MPLNQFVSSIPLIVGAIPILSAYYNFKKNAYRYKVREHNFHLENLPASFDGLKIVQFSDLHAGSLKKHHKVSRAVDIINEQEADIVFFTGDLVNFRAGEMRELKSVFSGIQSKIGVYSILGNHDYGDYWLWKSIEDKRDNLRRLKDTHGEMGWRLLMNESEVLESEDGSIAILGVENWSASPRFPKYGKLNEAYENSGKADVKLLLSHDPSHWKAQVTEGYKDIDITFSGHTHGFQLGIDWKGWEWSPAQYAFNEWAGLYKHEDQYLYVNRGLGFHGIPGRIGILPEISVFRLHRKESQT